MTEPPCPTETPPPTPGALAWLFLRLGVTAFGGPAAHIAMMEDEVVARRQWLTRPQFLDLLGATNLIPGPNSTEMAIHVGMLAGWRGFLLAGLCFILPAALLVGLLAWAYVAFGTLPQAEGILLGVKPVVLAVVLQALWKFGWTTLRHPATWSVFLGAGLGAWFGVNELLLLLAAGLGMMILRGLVRPEGAGAPLIVLPVVPAVGSALAGAAATPFTLTGLGLFFLKVGSVLFGSGYVLLAFLRADLVERWGWLSEGQLLDAIAVGQVTPGPVFTTATFVGYVLGGWQGAVVATVGIFLPAFFFVAVSGPLVPRLRQSPTAGAFLDGVVAASLALMAVVSWQLGQAALVDVPTVLLGAASLFLLVVLRVNSAWLVLAGAVIGFGLGVVQGR